MITHFLDGPVRRRFALPAFFRFALEDAFSNRTAFAATDNGQLVAVAAWLPPNARPPTGISRVRANVALAQVRALFPRGTPLMLEGFEALGELHPKEPHWYLAFVGVAPGRQRSGIGEVLVSALHDEADRAGLPCYLETPFPETHVFYQRLGYELLGEVNAFEGAPAVARFLRNAREPGSPS